MNKLHKIIAVTTKIQNKHKHNDNPTNTLVHTSRTDSTYEYYRYLHIKDKDPNVSLLISQEGGKMRF
jgi:hypothetical protein